MSQSRQLAAIMFTDIVGYTALMEKDEQKAMQLLDQNRVLQKPLIQKYRGKYLKEMGDGILASFSWRMIYLFVLGIYVALLMLFIWLSFSYQ